MARKEFLDRPVVRLFDVIRKVAGGQLVLASMIGNAIATYPFSGTRLIVKPGVFFLPKTTGRPIVAMHVRALKSFRLKSRWDRYEIPWPFSEVVISPARPLWVTVENEKESERMIRIHLGDL